MNQRDNFTAMTALTLLIADLAAPVGFATQPRSTALDAILAQSNVTLSDGQSVESAVLSAFGSATTSTASLTRLADTGEHSQTPWMRADPVHFAVSRDNVQLFDSHVVRPTAHEMVAIADTLNAHFAADGLGFQFPNPARGYVGLAADDVPITTPLWAMAGANVFDHLPRGHTTTNWRAITNEIQMLLHGHGVNVAREARGEPAINGLWCWGAGALPTSCASVVPFTDVFAHLAIARGAAMHFNLGLHTLATDYQSIAHVLPQNTLVVLHTPARDIRRGDPTAWANVVASIEANWLQPVHTAFNAGAISQLSLILPNEQFTLHAAVRRPTPLERITRYFTKQRRFIEYA